QLAEVPALAVRGAVDPVVPMTARRRRPVGAGEAILGARDFACAGARGDQQRNDKRSGPCARHPSLPFPGGMSRFRFGPEGVVKPAPLVFLLAARAATFVVQMRQLWLRADS